MKPSFAGAGGRPGTPTRPEPPSGRLGALAALVVAVLVISSGSRLGAGLPLAAALVLTEADDGRLVTLTAGQELQVRLRANPSTGFTWTTTNSNATALPASGDGVFVPDSSGLPGAGGTVTWAFAARQTGQAVVVFHYVKPWDPEHPAQTVTFTVDVAPPTVIPALRIHHDGSRVRLRWPVALGDTYFLEAAPDLTSSQWSAPNALRTTNGPDFEVSLPATSPARLYFRLHRTAGS